MRLSGLKKMKESLDEDISRCCLHCIAVKASKRQLPLLFGKVINAETIGLASVACIEYQCAQAFTLINQQSIDRSIYQYASV
ncbi:hypothetical protein T4D_12640 [Trichinella pseudospiralis]|uniref:Uncharacterized protein n=1 Tax=Trichinella pseudospiralis TaxID=6337 RepID=A0A0V1FA12_TRIPS|nr:hypothetical protein T4D_12640 [Trichinella pseudospiralis]